MATVYKFENLEIWQIAFSIYKRVSVIAEKLKKNHEFRLAEQMKAAAGSIMDNIAEGFERNSRLEYINSLSIAKGESGELQSQFHRCLTDKYIEKQEFDSLYSDTATLQAKIGKFISYLNKSQNKGLKFRNRTPAK